jgi:hypothetical protein
MIQFRGSEVVKLQHFEPASTDDIASVHARDYVSGLEKVTFFCASAIFICERLCFLNYGIFQFYIILINSA